MKRALDADFQKDIMTILATSPFRTVPENLFDMIRTPGIRYICGRELTRFAWWIPQVVHATQFDSHLLSKTSAELHTVSNERHITIAVDTHRNHIVVGCVALWKLGYDEHERGWFELGTLWVKPEYRFRGEQHMPIADALYRRILADHQSKNILATTTNHSAIRLGARHGMQMITFQSLPKLTHKATCVCPIEKTGTDDNVCCRLKDSACRVRVPFPTWQRIGQPQRIHAY